MTAKHASIGTSAWPPLDTNCGNFTHHSKIDDPLEPQIHLAFDQLADQFVASLLACAAAQQSLADAAKKK
jgi:hypothetical protein